MIEQVVIRAAILSVGREAEGKAISAVMASAGETSLLKTCMACLMEIQSQKN